MTSLAQMLLGGSPLTQPDAAVVSPSPTYQPEDIIKRRYNLADTLRDTPTAHSWAGVLANGLGAVGGNLVQGNADDAVQGNQALRKQDIQNAASATDLPGLEKSLIGAQTPDIQSLGLQTKIKQISDDPSKDYRVRAAQAIQYGMKLGTPEFRSFVLAGQLPAPKDPLDQEYKRAQIEKLQKVDPVDALVANMLGPQPQSGVPASSPTSPQAPSAQPPMLLPQNFDGVAPNSPNNPLLINVADTRAVPAGAPTAAPQPQPDESSEPQAGSDIIDTPFGKMSRADAIRKGGALTLSPKYAAAGKALLDAAQTGGAGIGLGKQAENINDKGEIELTDSMGQFKTIAQQFDPKYLNIPQRFSYSWSALKDKFGGLNPADQKDLSAYTRFRGNAWHSLNLVLKRLSGTAVTGNEMERQLLDQPNPGKYPWDGDSPTEFAAKLKNQVDYGISAIARARYLRNKGFTGIPWNDEAAVNALKAKGLIPEVNDMPGIINQRGQEIEQEYKQSHPNATPMQLQQATTRQIKQEFGI